MENKNRKPAALRCTAAVFAALMCASSLSGCLYMTGEKDDGPVVFPHESIDTSAYTYSEPEDNPADDLWQSLMDTPTANDGVDYTDEYYDNKQEGDFIYRPAMGEGNEGKACLIKYVGNQQDVVLPDKLGGLDVILVSNEVFEKNTSLRSVVIPEGYEDIYQGTFNGCTSLESITLPGSLETIGQSAFKGCSSLKSISIPEGVTKIEGWTFEDCKSLKNVSLPNGLMSIGNNAFSGCESLTEIVIPDRVPVIESYAFRGCTSLRSAVIGNGVTEIKGSAFDGCVNLVDITLGKNISIIGSSAFSKTGISEMEMPDKLIEIGSFAFSNCDNLKKVVIPASVQTLATNAFNGSADISAIEVDADSPLFYSDDGVLYSRTENTLVRFPSGRKGSYTVPDGIEKIGNYAFYDAEGITEIILPDSLKVIGESAFRKCGIEAIDIPGGVNNVGFAAFSEAKLESIVFPDSVTEIGAAVFDGCLNLNSVTFGKNTGSIGYGVFCNCPKLKEINIPESCNRYSFTNGLLIDNDNNNLISVLTSHTGKLTIPEGIVTLGDYCAYGCVISEVSIPSSVTAVGRNAFDRCEKLRTVNLGDSVTSIGFSAFNACTSLQSIDIPDSVTEIGQRAFGDCSNLRDVRLSNSVILLDSNTFVNCTSLRELIIPNSVTEVRSCCDGCTSLERIVMSDNVEKIGINAFLDCTSVRELYYPAGIDYNTTYFSYDSLERVYYGGSKRDWQLGFRVTSGYDYSLDDVEFIYDAQRPTE